MAPPLSSRDQNTLLKSFKINGLGIFSGKPVEIMCLPAPADSGIIFRCKGREIPADVHSIHSTPRSMILGKDGVTIQCVEHLLAAFKGCNLDNVIVEVDGGEIPICDGSARAFVEEIQKSGITKQNKSLEIRTLAHPIYWSQDATTLVVLPSNELRYSYTLNYPGHPLLHSQFYSFVMSQEGFVKDIASARTFSLYEEIQPLLEKGLIKGGGLENSVVIKGREVLNPDGLRFTDEMVRHKILDLIGDLSLIGFPLTAHFIAIRSGHASHAQLARRIQSDIRH